MDTLKNAFNLEIGYSDHSRSIAVPIAAAAWATIEKHLTLDRKLPGPDHQAFEPPEFRSMVEAIRQGRAGPGFPH